MNHPINEHFSPLGSQLDRRSPIPSTRGNILKSYTRPQPMEDQDAPVSNTGCASDPESHEPQIVVHRDGENITRIEYLCSCGRKSEISFEYDAE